MTETNGTGYEIRLFHRAVGTNLLHETRAKIQAAGRTVEDVVFIGSRETGHSLTWEQFERLADVEYDAGYGGSEVASDLIVAWADGAYLRRAEYDGSEWWDLVEPFSPSKVTERKPVVRLVRDEWHRYAYSLERLQADS